MNVEPLFTLYTAPETLLCPLTHHHSPPHPHSRTVTDGTCSLRNNWFGCDIGAVAVRSVDDGCMGVAMPPASTVSRRTGLSQPAPAMPPPHLSHLPLTQPPTPTPSPTCQGDVKFVADDIKLECQVSDVAGAGQWCVFGGGGWGREATAVLGGYTAAGELLQQGRHASRAWQLSAQQRCSVPGVPPSLTHPRWPFASLGAGQGGRQVRQQHEHRHPQVSRC